MAGKKQSIVQFEMIFNFKFTNQKGRKEKVDSLYKEFADRIKKEIPSSKLEGMSLMVGEESMFAKARSTRK